MFDVYLNGNRAQLLVVAKGQSIPIHWQSGRWQRKKAVVTVSDEIKMAIQRDGYIRANYESLKEVTSNIGLLARPVVNDVAFWPDADLAHVSSHVGCSG